MLGTNASLNATWSGHDTNWHLWTFVFQGNTTDTIYLDGVSFATGTSSGGAAQNIYPIFGNESSTTVNLDGKIDDAIIESRAWTAAEVKKYYLSSV